MTTPATCTISGALFNSIGAAIVGAKVRASITSSFIDAYGNYIASGIQSSTTTDSNGAWSLAVIQTQNLNQSVTISFIYPLNNNQSQILDYPVVVPNQSTANFSDLVDLSNSTAAISGRATTDNLPEGSVNLYYTDTRADARITAQKGAANGLAPLDGSSKISSTYLPAIAITDTFVVASQAAMLALAAQTGDVAVRTDTSTSYILAGTDPTILGNWQQLLSPPGAVLSVNSLTGNVVLTTDTVGEGVTNLYFTNARAQAAISGTSPISVSSGVVSIQTANTSQAGAISSTDWNTFNNKQSALSFGNLTESTSSVLTITGGTGAVIGSGASIQVKLAGAAQSGYLSSTDWNTFNSKGSGTVTSVSVTTANGVSGSVATSTTTPAITLTLGAITPSSVAATGTVSGSNLSGTNTGDQTITLTGNVTGSGTGSFATTIANGAVTNAMLAGSIDLSTKVTGTLPQTNLPNPVTSALSGTSIDWSLTNKIGGGYTKTLGANTTFTFSNATSGQTIVVRLTNTASNYTVTWPTVKWSGGSAPTMTVGAKSDVYTFYYDGTDYFGSAVQNMS